MKKFFVWMSDDTTREIMAFEARIHSDGSLLFYDSKLEVIERIEPVDWDHIGHAGSPQ